MPVKYAPSHANWVGASTKGYTVDVLHVSRHPFGTVEAQWRLAQYPQSSLLMREGRRYKEREKENILLSNAAFDFFFFFSLNFQWHSYCGIIFLFIHFKNYFRFCIGIWCQTCVNAVREYFKLEFQTWQSTDSWHVPWNWLFSVSKPILLHGLSAGRTL